MPKPRMHKEWMETDGLARWDPFPNPFACCELCAHRAVTRVGGTEAETGLRREVWWSLPLDFIRAKHEIDVLLEGSCNVIRNYCILEIQSHARITIS